MESQSLNIGVHIAALRKAKGLTQEQLAARIGVSAQRSASGRQAIPTLTLRCCALWHEPWERMWTPCFNLRKRCPINK